MTYADSLRAHHTEIAATVNEMLEAITMRDWDGVSDLTFEMHRLADEMHEAARNLRIAAECAPRGDV